MERSVDTLVVALCLDYPRRQRAIEEGSVSHRTENEFRYYNFKIFEAAAEVVGEDIAPTFIEEIACRRGYAYSAVENMCESTYKIKKQLVKDNIAKRLHLID